MKNKDIKLFMVIILVCLLIGYLGLKYLQKNNQTTEDSKTQSISIPSQNEIKQTNTTNNYPNNQLIQKELSSNYDYIMANDSLGMNATAKTDFYSLVLSWSPDFCSSKQNNIYKYQYQCHKLNNFGWVIHGLWAENKKASSIKNHPRFCQGDLPKVNPNILKKYLNNSPSASLLQGEWEKHGACIFKQADDYFTKQQQLFNSLKLPNTKIANKKTLIEWIKQNNPQFRYKYIKLSKNELHFCYDLNWQPINCN